MKVIVLTIGVSVLCLAGGCSKVAKEAAERTIESELAGEEGTANVEIGEDGFTMQIKGDDGKAVFDVGSGAKIPDKFPDDVPVYPGLTIRLSHAQQQQSMFMIQATSSDSLNKLAEFYQQETGKHGWVEESSTRQGEKMQMFNYAKDDRNLNVVLATDQQGTNLTLNTSQK